MTTTSASTDRGRSRSRRPALDRHQATALATEETARFVALVRSLDDRQWSLPTDCAEWDVRALVSHVVGAMEAQVSKRQFVHQLVAGTRAAGDRPQVDGINEVQVRERAAMAPRELTERISVLGPRSAVARTQLSSLLRRFSFPQHVGDTAERWTLGYLFEVIYTRDTWMHRVDISRTVGRPLELTAAHDGLLVADVVAEWAQRHGQPFTLVLTGPAGGTFTGPAVGNDTRGERLELDAVEFCRVVSGRGSGQGLLAQPVPF